MSLNLLAVPLHANLHGFPAGNETYLMDFLAFRCNFMTSLIGGRVMLHNHTSVTFFFNQKYPTKMTQPVWKQQLFLCGTFPLHHASSATFTNKNEATLCRVYKLHRSITHKI